MLKVTYNFHLGMSIQSFDKIQSHFRHILPSRLYLAYDIFQCLRK